MEIRQCESPQDVASAGANFIAARVTEAVAERGQFLMALSGGSTPWIMLDRLAEQQLPWDRVKVFQVDERAAPEGNPERNLVQIREHFSDRVSLPPENLCAMPISADDLNAGARQYQQTLVELAGEEPVIDVVHLGLGVDGHTASLVPGDPVLKVSNRDVATTEIYNGRRRMTLTYPIINRARHILWLITGEEKAQMLGRMIQGDDDIPAGCISQVQATVLADDAALRKTT